MNSVDKLREWARNQIFNNPECGKLTQKGIRKVDKIADEIEAEIAANYCELPKDKNGETVHIGDEIRYPNGTVDKARFITLREYGWVFNERGWVPSQCTHYHAPTIEDVLIEMMEQAVGFSDAHTTVALNAVSEYADKLREVLRDGSGE